MSNDELKEQLKALFSDAVDNVFSGWNQDFSLVVQKKLIELIEDFENQMDIILWNSD